MRDSIENISQLQKQLNELQLENQLLKNILDRAGLSYHKELSAFRQTDEKETYDPQQGKRIVHPQVITETMANQFFTCFGEDRMLTLNAVLIKNLEKLPIILNAIIFGRMYVIRKEKMV